jgi:hypothetical protein
MTSRPTDRASVNELDLAKVNQELLGAIWEKGWPAQPEGARAHGGEHEPQRRASTPREGRS